MLEKLLKEYFLIFLEDELFPEWADATDEDKISMLKEAIKDKKNLSETKLFEEKYGEKVL